MHTQRDTSTVSPWINRFSGESNTTTVNADTRKSRDSDVSVECRPCEDSVRDTVRITRANGRTVEADARELTVVDAVAAAREGGSY